MNRLENANTKNHEKPANGLRQQTWTRPASRILFVKMPCALLGGAGQQPLANPLLTFFSFSDLHSIASHAMHAANRFNERMIAGDQFVDVHVRQSMWNNDSAWHHAIIWLDRDLNLTNGRAQIDAVPHPQVQPFHINSGHPCERFRFSIASRTVNPTVLTQATPPPKHDKG